jgi:hypothetical protein
MSAMSARNLFESNVTAILHGLGNQNSLARL